MHRHALMSLALSVLAFVLPAYHLTYTKDGVHVLAIDDMTLKECQTRAAKFKKSAHAQCVFDPGERELT